MSHRIRRWSDVKPTLIQRLVSAAGMVLASMFQYGRHWNMTSLTWNVEIKSYKLRFPKCSRIIAIALYTRSLYRHSLLYVYMLHQTGRGGGGVSGVFLK